MRIPLAADLQINAFNKAAITELESGITNGVVDKSSGRIYVTQRPAINITEDASTLTDDAKGRAVFYWDEVSALYFINNDTLYKNSHANAIGTIGSGINKCKIVLLDSTLVIIDVENNAGYTLSTAEVLTEITDTDFPPKKTTPETLTYGCVVLDGYVFVLTTEGKIYGSDSGSATSWSALGFLAAERESDGGVYIGKHHDHIVAYGVRTIEVFYNNTNLVGSPLNRRQDVEYTTGCADGRSVWEAGDRHFFVGSDSPGSRRVYMMDNFQLVEISTPTIVSLITQATVKDSFVAMGSGFSAHGRNLYLLTIYEPTTETQVDSFWHADFWANNFWHADFWGTTTTSQGWTPKLSLAYDDSTKLWYIYETAIGGHTQLPIVDWSIRSGSLPRAADGIMINGDLITINDNMRPTDTLAGFKMVETGVVEPGILLETAAETSNIEMKARSGMQDNGTGKTKRSGPLTPVADKTNTTQTLTVKWASEKNSDMNSGETLDTSINDRLTRTGTYYRRNYEVVYAGEEAYRIEAIEGDVDAGVR